MKKWCRGVGMKGGRLRNHPRYDTCPVCGAVFVKSGRLPLPMHKEGAGDVAMASLYSGR